MIWLLVGCGGLLASLLGMVAVVVGVSTHTRPDVSPST